MDGEWRQRGVQEGEGATLGGGNGLGGGGVLWCHGCWAPLDDEGD